MRMLFLAVLLIAITIPALSLTTDQSTTPDNTPKWLPATITAVEPHPGAQDAGHEPTQYDVSLRVGNTLYVVLYTPSPRSSIVTYRVGVGLHVLIGNDSLTFRDLMGRATVVPILSREPISAQTQQ
jgi:hypothetical protein